jgi:cysteine desulfurase
MNPQHIVYLDHSASTPTDPRVVEAMLPYFTENYGNPSSAHSIGRQAEQAIETARATVANILNCQPAEIVFTSGGSESDNLAIRGAGWWAKQNGRGAHFITTPIEHSAVGRTMSQMAGMMGFEQTHLLVHADGIVDMDSLRESLRDDTALVSIIYANNEVGTIQPLRHIADIVHDSGALLHTDAVQAAGQLTLDVQELGVDMLSISAHKFYGPKGVGALYVREGIELIPSQSGGSHEEGRRAGTHNTPFIVGLAKALQLAHDEQQQRNDHYRTMRDALIAGVLERIDIAELTGHPENRLPSHASFTLEGVDANKLLMHMDMRGVCASSASACKTGNPEPSATLLALGYPEEKARGSLRLTVGQSTTADDVAYALDVIEKSVQTVQKLQKVLSS